MMFDVADDDDESDMTAGLPKLHPVKELLGWTVPIAQKCFHK